MAYTGSLTTGEQLHVENQGTQTVVTLFKGGSNQQQSQGSSFETGKWLQPPTLFRTQATVVLGIEADRGQFFIQLQAGSLGILSSAPSLMGAEILPLQHAADSSSTNMPSMRPMEPLQMGNMQMSMNPMQMRMGDMQMQMGKTESTSSSDHFCPQCGGAVKSSDRFCSKCGNRLAN